MARERDPTERRIGVHGRPPQPRRGSSGKWLALALAVLVNLAFVGVLVFSVTWRNDPAPALSADLYAPPVRKPDPKPEPRKPDPPKPEPPKPEPPKPEPKPDPEPPKPEPKPEPPKVEKPDPREAEIALKAKQEEERKRREQDEERKRRDQEEERKRREQDEQRLRAEAEKRKREAAEKLKADAKREAEVRERQERELQALRDLAEREAKARADAAARARVAAERAAVQAENAARAKAEADWIRRIQAKVKGNVILPPDLQGNPEAIFDVVQLPTGEILDVQLRKSSGVRSYDEAVQRAILKSSPLPRPDRPDLFQRTLQLRFRPVD